MEWISLAAATSLTDWSERTFWRRFADGTIPRKISNDRRCMVPLDALQPHMWIQLDDENLVLLRKAEAGEPDAVADLALLLLEHDRAKSAIYWLELAARQGHADAMHWLGRCHLEGAGTRMDQSLGMMWLAKAASTGHLIARAQLQSLLDKALGRDVTREGADFCLR